MTGKHLIEEFIEFLKDNYNVEVFLYSLRGSNPFQTTFALITLKKDSNSSTLLEELDLDHSNLPKLNKVELKLTESEIYSILEIGV